jgi:hypothetical protein
MVASIGAVAVLALCAVPAAAAAVAPAWKLNAVSAPTNFSADEVGTQDGGPAYLLEATNVGGAATSGPLTVQATLPPGVRPSSAIGTADGFGSPQPSCSISIQVVTCTTPGPVQPSLAVMVAIVVDTDADLAGTAVAEMTVSGGDAAPAAAVVKTPVTTAPPSFGFLAGAGGLASSLTEADGSPAGLAGSHPHQLTVGVGFPSLKAGGALFSSGSPRDIFIDLPQGLIVNPAAPAVCTEEQLIAAACPPASQIGLVTLTTATVAGLGADSRPLYNMLPPPGSAANFGFNAADLSIFIHMLGSVRLGDYGLSASVEDLLAKFPILGMKLQLWGDPSSPTHDAARLGGSIPPRPASFLTLPSACGPPLTLTARTDSWEDPGAFVTRSVENQDLEGEPIEVSGCNELAFSPQLEARPTTPIADSPSGFEVKLDVPQNEAPTVRASANLMRARVTLPEGLVANPAGANGLAGCSPAQIGLSTPVGASSPRFDAGPIACPDAARIGAAEVETPLLDHPLLGSVFLATPHDNPFGSLLALYLTAEDDASGIVFKLAGKLEADPVTGRLTASFEELPELPIASVDLRLFGGPTAPLRTPATCGAYATISSLTPWSAPESGPPATPSDSYPIDRSPIGPTCALSESALPDSRSLDAGSVSPAAGSYSPFVFSLLRKDGTQQLSSTTLVTPPGLAAKLAGIPYCPEEALAEATARSGSLEQADPSCPADSRVGSARVGAGAGPAPYHVQGSAYLAGPYKGAPLSLVVIVPAVAGPFDLGTVVVRSALHVNPETARVTAVSDPIPSILRGIPLDVRSLRVTLDRAGFIRNPTSCDPMAVGAQAASPTGGGAPLLSRFQMGGCRRLGFAPKVSLRFFGPTHRGAHPKFRTVLTARRGDANIRRFAITLPGTELLDNRRIGTICTRARFAARRCPAGSVHGYAKAWSPLLGRPLEGPVYLRASDDRLPGLAISLHGQVDLTLSGRIDSVHGRLRNTFQALPDVPLSKVVLTMRGGNRGLLVNSGGLCARHRHVGASFIAQNAKTHESHPLVRTACGERAGQPRSRLPGPRRWPLGRLPRHR